MAPPLTQPSQLALGAVVSYRPPTTRRTRCNRRGTATTVGCSVLPPKQIQTSTSHTSLIENLAAATTGRSMTVEMFLFVPDAPSLLEHSCHIPRPVTSMVVTRLR